MSLEKKRGVDKRNTYNKTSFCRNIYECCDRRAWIRLSQELKKQADNVEVILGGVTATTNPELCLKRSKADLLVIGKDENTLLELMRRYKDRGDFGVAVRGTAFL